MQTEVLQAIPRPGRDPGAEVEAWRFAQAKNRLAAANEAIRSTRTFFFALLSVAVYIGVVIAGTTDEQLLRISPVELPIIGVEVPLTGFYIFVPWLFVLLHFNLLIHLGLTARKLKRFLDDIDPLDAQLADRLRNDVSNFPLAQWMVGRQDALFRAVLAVLVWLLLVLVPPFLLLWIQLRFLAFQDEAFTWLQAAAVAVNVLLIVGFRAWFARHIQPHTRWLSGWKQFGGDAKKRLALFFRLTVSQPLFRYLIPLIPVALAWHLAAGLSDLLQAEKVASRKLETTQSRDGRDIRSWLCERYRLNLSEKLLVRNTPPPDVVNALYSGDEGVRKRALDQVLGIALRGRHFLGANFEVTFLPKADLRAAWLGGSDLSEARLEGANLSAARLEGTNLSAARLEGANLRGARLEGANLSVAQLKGADLRGAQLKGADLGGAQLVGTNLRWVSLEGADLQGASLESADLGMASLEGADLRWASLESADLRRSREEGGELLSLGGSLEGVDLRGARLEGANLGQVDLAWADLSAIYSLAIYVRTDLAFADLRDVKNLETTELAGADYVFAELEGTFLDINQPPPDVLPAP